MASAVVGALKVLLQADTAQFEAKLKTLDTNTQRLANRLKNDLTPSQKAVNSAVREFLGTKEIGNAERYAAAIKEIGGANKLTAQDQARVNRAVTEALNHYRALGQQAPAHLIKLQKETRQTAADTQKLTTAFTSMRGVLGAFGVSLGAAGLVQFGRHVFDAADSIVDLSNKMGVSTEAAQRFRFAARQSGADLEQVTQSIVKMNDKLATGDKSTIKALNDLGLNFQKIRAMKPEDAFRAIVDAIGAIDDPMKQTQVGIDLFGKSFADILPMIREKSLEAADGIKVMSDETIKQLEAAKQAWQNFFDDLTILTGETLASLPGAWDLFWTQFRKKMQPGPSGLGGVANFLGGMANPHAFAQSLVAQAAIDDMNKPKDINLGVEPGKPLPTKQTVVEVSEDLKRAAEAAEKAYQAWKRSTIGLSDAERELLGHMLRLAKEGGPSLVGSLLKIDTAIEGIIDRQSHSKLAASIMQIGVAARLTADQITAAQRIADSSSLIRPIDGLFAKGMSVDDLMKGVNTSGVFATTIKQMWSSLPNVLMSAFTGGGNIGRSIGGWAGGELSGGLAKKVGGWIGKLIPGFGTLFGGLLGGAFDKLFGPREGARTNNMRDEFMAARGGLDAIHRQIAEFNNDPQLLAAFNRLYFTGKEGDFKKGMDAYQKRLTELQQRQAQVLERTGLLGNALTALGGIAPRALDPLINSLLGQNIPPELRSMLVGSQKPNWQLAFQAAQELGIDEGVLGRGLKQAKVSEQGFDLLRKFEMFERFGSDMNGVLQGMADEFSALADEAFRNGVALPKQLENVFRRLATQGLLVDREGNAIALEQLQFEEMEDEKLNEAVRLLEEIRDLLAGRAPGTGPKTGVPTDVTGGSWVPGLPEVRLPGFGGGYDQYMDAGVGKMESAAAFGSGEPQMMTVIYEADGRQLSRVVMPYVGGEVKRLGLVRS